MKKLSPIYMIIVLLSDRTSRKKCVCVVLPRTSVLIIIPAVRKPIPTRLLSDPAEAAWMSYYSSKKHLDGYLRWAYNSWPLEPLLDSRFRSWAGGDTYLVYPGARSCIRFERLIEGIQAHEKINILRQNLRKRK